MEDAPKTAEEWQQKIDKNREQTLAWIANMGTWMVENNKRMNQIDARFEAFMAKSDERMEKIEGHLGKIADILEGIESRLPPPNGAGGLKMGQ